MRAKEHIDGLVGLLVAGTKIKSTASTLNIYEPGIHLVRVKNCDLAKFGTKEERATDMPIYAARRFNHHVTRSQSCFLSPERYTASSRNSGREVRKPNFCAFKKIAHRNSRKKSVHRKRGPCIRKIKILRPRFLEDKYFQSPTDSTVIESVKNVISELNATIASRKLSINLAAR